MTVTFETALSARVDTMADAASTEKVSQAGVADNLTSLLATMQAFQTR